MKTFLVVILTAFIAAAAVAAYFVWNGGMEGEEAGTLVREERLICGDGTAFTVQFLSNEHVIVNPGGVPYELAPAVSASGTRYANEDGSFVFWNRGAESMVLVNEEVVLEACRLEGTEANDNDNGDTDDGGAAENDVSDMIRLTSPLPDAVVESPLTLEGEARGPWFFEATFPIVLTNWDGLIIAEGYATSEGEWMTEEFVPFSAELEFESPYSAGDPDFMKRGTLILQKANASGLPEHDAALEITVYFAE